MAAFEAVYEVVISFYLFTSKTNPNCDAWYAFKERRAGTTV